MPDTQNIVKATFTVRGSGESFAVHFNPQSLQYTITNNLRNTGSGNSSKQYVSDSTGKLTMDLIFDTTDTGEDVRLHTVRVAQLMEPSESDHTPPVVEFEWGLYTFSGMVETYRETIDFFSADGVPLRASVNLTLASQDQVFEGGSTARRANTGGSMAGAGAAGGAGSGAGSVRTPAPTADDGRGLTRTATQAGNPGAARAIAAGNNIENIRFPGTGQIELNASLQVSGAAGISTGAGFSADLGGFFAGLRTEAAGKESVKLSLAGFLRPGGTACLGTENPAAFAVGGQARLQGSASFTADVGRAGDLKGRIEFDER
jgi:hypothetical protein